MCVPFQLGAHLLSFLLTSHFPAVKMTHLQEIWLDGNRKEKGVAVDLMSQHLLLVLSLRLSRSGMLIPPGRKCWRRTRLLSPSMVCLIYSVLSCDFSCLSCDTACSFCKSHSCASDITCLSCDAHGSHMTSHARRVALHLVYFNTDVVCVGFLIKCKKSELEEANVLHDIDNSRLAESSSGYSMISLN